MTTDKHAVFPYFLNRHVFPDDVLSTLRDLVIEHRLEHEIFHECAASIQDFTKYMNDFPRVISSIAVDLVSGDLAGFFWLDDVTYLENGLLRAAASFCFFPKFWNTEDTSAFAKIALSQWFNLAWKKAFRNEPIDPSAPTGEGFDVLYGQTPKPNRAARLFTARMGFRYIAEIPGFTSYHGETVPVLIALQTRDEFNARG